MIEAERATCFFGEVGPGAGCCIVVVIRNVEHEAVVRGAEMYLFGDRFAASISCQIFVSRRVRLKLLHISRRLSE